MYVPGKQQTRRGHHDGTNRSSGNVGSTSWGKQKSMMCDVPSTVREEIGLGTKFKTTVAEAQKRNRRNSKVGASLLTFWNSRYLGKGKRLGGVGSRRSTGVRRIYTVKSRRLFATL